MATPSEQIKGRINGLGEGQLKEMALALCADSTDEASFVMSAILDELMKRMDEPLFVAFCDYLDEHSFSAKRVS